MNRIIPILLITFLLSTKLIGQDSILDINSDSLSKSILINSSQSELLDVVEEQNKSLIELQNKLDDKSDSSVPIIGYALAFFGVLISAGVAFVVGTNQGKSNLKIKKIDILTADKLKLTELKKEIIGRKSGLPANQTLTQEQMGTSAIDSIVFRILEVLKISEYFNNEFIVKITEYNNSLQIFMGAAKLGKPINEAKAQSVLSKMRNIEDLIANNINKEIKKRQNEIDYLL